MSRDVRQAIAGCASMTSACGPLRHHLLIGSLQPFAYAWPVRRFGFKPRWTSRSSSISSANMVGPPSQSGLAGMPSSSVTASSPHERSDMRGWTTTTPDVAALIRATLAGWTCRHRKAAHRRATMTHEIDAETRLDSTCSGRVKSWSQPVRFGVNPEFLSRLRSLLSPSKNR